MRHSLIYCRNCPHLFDGFYPRTGTSSIFPSAAHCLDISPDCPGFLRFSHSLFTCCSPILSSTKTSPVLVQSRHAQVEKKNSGSCFSDQCKGARLGHAGSSATYGRSEFDHPGVSIGIQFLSGFLWVSFQWRHRISDVSL